MSTTNPRPLVLERKDQADETPTVGAISMTPPITEDYWTYRVVVADGQAIVGFPKFNTIGIGFAVEEDWNTNLPYSVAAEELLEHIGHNRGSDDISDETCLEAIRLIQAAARADRGDPPLPG